MMHASMEEGRTPLAPFSVQTEDRQQDSLRICKRRQNLLRIAAAVSFVVTPLASLASFSYNAAKWTDNQVAHWSFDGSMFDWVVLSSLRDVFVLAVLLFQRQKVEASARLARRACVVALLLGMGRLSMLDWTVPNAKRILVPSVTWACLIGPVLCILAQVLVMAATAHEKAVAEASGGTKQEDADGDTPQYSSSLTLYKTIMVLKPYFWPSTGKTSEVLLNRARALSTWVCVAGSKVLNIMAPLYLAQATNGLAAALNSGPGPHPVTNMIIYNIVMYTMLTLLSKALKELQSLVYIKVQQAAYIEIADNTFQHLHSLSLDWHLRKKMGNVIRSMDRGIAAAQNTMQYVFLYLVPTICEALAVTLIFIIYFKNSRLAVFVFLNLTLYCYVTVQVTLWRKRFRTAATKHDNELHDRLTDSLVNYETVKYFTAEHYESQQYRAVVEKFQTSSMATQVSLSVLNVLQQVIVNFALAGGMIISVSRVLEEHGSIGDFVAVNAYVINIFLPLNFLGTIYNMVVTAVVDMKSFGQLLAEKTEVMDKPGAPALDLAVKPGPMVEFRNVSFNYSKQPLGRSIKDMSFKVSRGGTMALVGPTGAGKTTVTRLLFRFYDATAGEVLVNSQGVKNITQHSLRRAIGMVPQDVVMFNSTIAHNIGYGRIDGASQADIEKAAERAQLTEFIRQQQLGYETVVGERGLKLSGGEKQRLAIARCLLKDPPIVVLDEATSALDSQTESLVQEALNVLSNDRTVIAIAHRLSTIKAYDEIIVIDAGEVLERGSHEELLAKEGSRYSAMWSRQAAGVMEDTPHVNGAGVGLS